jgi:hypothetical protein
LLLILAILIPLLIIARPVVRTFEASWYRFVERRERGVDRSTATNSISIGRTTASYATWGEGRVLVIWCDLRGNSGGGASSSGADGSVVAAGGRRMDWRCDSADGVAGSVQIDGVPYDLARGTSSSSARRGSGPASTSCGATCRRTGRRPMASSPSRRRMPW